MQLAPFAQAHPRQEAVPAIGLQAARRLLVLEQFVVEVPHLHVGEEVGALVDEDRVRRIGGLALVHRPVARILHRQRRRHDEPLAQAVLLLGRHDHASHARVDRQLRELRAGGREVEAFVDRAELRQQLVAVGDHARLRRLDEREALRFAQLERLHAQDHRGERRAQDLRIGELGARIELVLRIQAHAHAARHPAAAAGALVGRGARDRFHLQHLDLVAIAVAVDARDARVDHVADARHRQRGFGHIGGEHHAMAGVGAEHAVLLGTRQAREQGQHLDAAADPPDRVLAQMLGGLADLAFARQEHQCVAGAVRAIEVVERIGNRRRQVGLLALGVGRRRPVADLDRIQTPGDLDHGRVAEVRREALRVDGGRGDDQLEIRPARQQLMQEAEQEIDVETALVRLVDDQRVVGAQAAIGLGLGEQDAVGHELHERLGTDAIVEADLEADQIAERRLQFLSDPRRNRARRDPAWLRVADEPGNATAGFEADLGQLGGLARPGFAADDHHLMRQKRRRDLVAAFAHRQLFGVGDHRQALPAQGKSCGRDFDGGVERGDLRLVRRCLRLAQPRELATQATLIGQHAVADAAPQGVERGPGLGRRRNGGGQRNGTGESR